MSKHRQQTKTKSNNRLGTSMSVEPEAPHQVQDQADELMQARTSQTSQEWAPTFDEIQLRAYQIHEEKGGSDLDNWLEAEQVLRKEARL